MAIALVEGNTVVWKPAEAVESFKAEVSMDALPPVLVLSGLVTLAVPKGAQIEESITVRNVGGSDLTDVSLSLESDPLASMLSSISLWKITLEP